MKIKIPLLLVLLAAGCDRSKEQPVCIASWAGALENFPFDMAQDLGYFREEGVQVTLERPSKPTEAVVGGSCDITYGAYAAELQAAAAGQRLKTFFVAVIRSTVVFVASPQKADRIRRVEDLKGALVEVTNFGGAFDVMTRHLLRQHGMAASDVTMIPTGSGAPMVAALERGKVDAGFLTSRAFAVLRRRAPATRILMDPRTAEGSKTFFGAESVATYSLTARPEWLTQRPEDARRIAKALVRTLTWIREHSLEEVYARMQPKYRTEDKEADVEALRIVLAALSPDGRMPSGAAEAVQRVVSAADERVLKIDLASTYTNQFLEPK